MRLKEANNKIAHIAWSPSTTYPSYIASGTAAEQFDSSFSTKSSLDLLKLDLANPSTELELDGSIVTEARFSKLIWSNYETSNAKNLIIGGCENSNIYLFDHEKIISNRDPNAGSACVVQTLQKHTGSVLSLDTNPFQHNLLASGAGSSEIFVWDLNSPNVPMTPGAKIQPLDDINCVSWNNQVQHILASTCSGKCIVWDLRKNESIIKVSDNMSKMRAKLVVWHPDVATQMCLSSDDDHTPYLQLWDLRFATSPVRILEGHTR
jgi:protein transport protein SEC31